MGRPDAYIASPSGELIVQASQGDVHAQAKVCVISMASGDASHEYREAVVGARSRPQPAIRRRKAFIRGNQFGLGISQDDQLAIEWYDRAAAQQNAQAMYMLGQLSRKSARLPMRRAASRCCNEQRRLGA